MVVGDKITLCKTVRRKIYYSFSQQRIQKSRLSEITQH